jgi:hypothetical protein
MQVDRSVASYSVWLIMMCVGCAVDNPDTREASQAVQTEATSSAVERELPQASPEASLCFCPIEPIIAGPDAQVQLAAQVSLDCQAVCGICGDGVCSVGEPLNCPFDCAPASLCGDGVCDFDESQLSCPFDCGPPPVCGNFVCEGNESFTCSSDCVPPPTPCGDGLCKNAFSVNSAQAQERVAWATRCAANPAPGVSGTPRPGTQYYSAQSSSTYGAANPVLRRYLFPVYFDFVTGGSWSAPDSSGTSCAVLPTSAINATMCVAGCVPTAVCGNGVCESGESSSSCAADCGPPPPVCGDGFCQFPETSSTCRADCGLPLPTCGDGICQLRENCQLDCGGGCFQLPCPIEPVQ